MTRELRVLFLSKRNAARTLIAETILRRLARGRLHVTSAGTDPARRAHPQAAPALNRLVGGSLSSRRPKPIASLSGEHFDVVILLDDVDQRVLSLVSFAASERWDVDDPSRGRATRDERRTIFDRSARALMKRMRDWWKIARPEAAGAGAPGIRPRLPRPRVLWRTVPPIDSPTVLFVYLGPHRRCINMCAYLRRSGYHVLCGDTFARAPESLRLIPDVVVVRADGKAIPGQVRDEFAALAPIRKQLRQTPMLVVFERIPADEELGLLRETRATEVLFRKNEQLLLEIARALTSTAR